MSESVVLTEGYHDRAFWSGWLEYLGCENLGRRLARTHRIRVLDPWNVEVAGGEFAFHSKSKRFVRIVPCRGKDNLLPLAESRLKDRVDRGLTRLVISADSDEPVVGTDSTQHGVSYHAVETLARQFGDAKKDEYGDLLLNDGATVVSLVRWEASDGDRPGLPNRQTLERVVCASLVAAYPDRGSAVQRWLDSRADGPEPASKEFAWSHMAGWYADRGCEDFYRAVWSDSKVVAELEARLRESGAWRVVEALTE